MNLHEDSEVFSELIQFSAETIGLPQIYVEKDYWVTRALKHLSHSEHADKIVFKGGTSLSKAYRLIDRFSEDIDLAITPMNISNNAKKSLIRRIETDTIQGLIYLEGDTRESKGSHFRKTVYQYPRSFGENNFGQASSELLLEINAFANPSPNESRQLQSFVSEVLALNNKNDLIKQYGLETFSINVLSVERTLIEKILGIIKDSYHNDPRTQISRRVRHLYDINQILKHDIYRQFVMSKNFMPLVSQCIEDEKAGFFIGSEFLDHPLQDAPLFSKFPEWRSAIGSTYKGPFSALVYGELPTLTAIEDTLTFIKEAFR